MILPILETEEFQLPDSQSEHAFCTRLHLPSNVFSQRRSHFLSSPKKYLHNYYQLITLLIKPSYQCVLVITQLPRKFLLGSILCNFSMMSRSSEYLGFPLELYMMDSYHRAHKEAQNSFSYQHFRRKLPFLYPC